MFRFLQLKMGFIKMPGLLVIPLKARLHERKIEYGPVKKEVHTHFCPIGVN